MDKTDKQVKVVFTPSGRRGSFAVNTPLLHAARVLGVDITRSVVVVASVVAARLSVLKALFRNIKSIPIVVICLVCVPQKSNMASARHP